jgi:glycine/D-amino acid oxidase-like deaminating enzyme
VAFENSLWHHTSGQEFTPRPPLPGDIEADVAIAGAGYTGLWTAYYLHEIDPALRIAIVEREIAGFGASGRNGGWCSALFPPASSGIVRRHGLQAAVAMRRAMHASVVEVGRVAEREGIDVDYARGGTISLARSEAQLTRARELVEEERRLTGPVEGLELLSKEEADRIARATRVLGATYTPHCAVVHPLKLVRGLAERVEARGVSIFERTCASSLRQGELVTEQGSIRAEVVVRATEGYTASLRGERRRFVPLYSLMIATEPLPAAVWDEIGLRRRETFADLRHMRIYGQRTADDRFAFGGRGAPYHFRSRTRPDFDRDERVHSMLRFLGVNGGRLLMTYADRAEARSGRPARSAKALARFIGY